jgi:diamine N-acetyltransferase
MAQTGVSGRSEMIVLPSGAKGEPVVTLSAVSDTAAKALGAGFAAIDPWARYPYPASALEAYFVAQEPGAPRYAIGSGGETIGALGLRLNWLRGPYIQFLGMLPGKQSRGLGGRVLGWVEADARNQGARNIWVAASDFNAGAIRFYERHGFTRAADLEGLVRDGKTEVLMRKRI